MAFGDTFVGKDLRPYTEGKLEGKDAKGKAVSKDKKFLISSASAISSIDEKNFKNFAGAVRAAGVAKDVAKGVAPVYKGGAISFVFEAKDAKGKAVTKRCSLRFAVVPTDNILGADQQANQKVTLTFSPNQKIAKLTED